MSVSIFSLPNDITRFLFSYLDPLSLLAVKFVCKKFRTISTEIVNGNSLKKVSADHWDQFQQQHCSNQDAFIPLQKWLAQKLKYPLLYLLSPFYEAVLHYLAQFSNGEIANLTDLEDMDGKRCLSAQLYLGDPILHTDVSRISEMTGGGELWGDAGSVKKKRRRKQKSKKTSILILLSLYPFIFSLFII